MAGRFMALRVLIMGMILILLPGIAAAQTVAPASPASQQPASSQQPTASQQEVEAIFAAFDEDADKARQFLSQLGEVDGEPSIDQIAKLTELRNAVARDRDRALSLASRGTMTSRILEAQIDALGPPPAEGESEPAIVAARREALQEQQGIVTAPAIRLREASARASVIVTAIDARIRAMKRARLIERGLSFIDPRLWYRTVVEIGNAVTVGKRNAAQNLGKYGVLDQIAAFAVAIALIAGAPLVGMFLWRKLSARLSRRVLEEGSVAKKLLVSVLQDALAGLIFALALIAMTVALMIFLLPIVPVEALVAIVVSVMLAGILLGIAQWIGRGVLMSPFPELRLVTLPPARADMALAAIRQMAIVLGAELVISALEKAGFIGSNFARFASAALVAVGAWLLWQLANYLREGRKYYDERRAMEPGGDAPGLDFATPISRLMKLFAIIAIGAAVVGYELIARFFFASSLLSLSLVGMAVYLHRSFVLVVNAFAKGSMARFRRGLHLLPLLTGLILTIAVIALLAIIWGYEPSEIADAFIMLRTGIEFGEIRISAGDIVTFAAVFFIGFFITRWLQRFLKLSIMPEFGMDTGAEAAILTFIGYIGIFLAALIAIATTGLDLSSLAFVAGALSVGLGFGLQSVVENFTSGILLLIERPIKVGDWIEVGEHSGIVRKIAVRSTHIETFDRHQIIVPNSQLISGVVKNRSFSTGPARIVVPVGVAYGSDLDRVQEILLDIAKANESVLEFPEPAVAMEGFGDSSINVKILAFVHQATDGAPTASALNFAIARRFAEEGIEIPFPQRDLHVKNWPPRTDEAPA